MVYRSFSTCFKLCEQWNSITKCPSDLVATSICLKALVILERDGRFNTPTTAFLIAFSKHVRWSSPSTHDQSQCTSNLIPVACLTSFVTGWCNSRVIEPSHPFQPQLLLFRLGKRGSIAPGEHSPRMLSKIPWHQRWGSSCMPLGMSNVW